MLYVIVVHNAINDGAEPNCYGCQLAATSYWKMLSSMNLNCAFHYA